jgi:hypothetical protein
LLGSGLKYTVDVNELMGAKNWLEKITAAKVAKERE